jgi:hypothetical protein
MSCTDPRCTCACHPPRAGLHTFDELFAFIRAHGDLFDWDDVCSDAAFTLELETMHRQANVPVGPIDLDVDSTN